MIYNVGQAGGKNYTEVTGVLNIGSTSLILSDEIITTDSTIDIYTDIYGVNPTDVVINNGSVELTFKAQESVVNVKVRVS